MGVKWRAFVRGIASIGEGWATMNPFPGPRKHESTFEKDLAKSIEQMKRGEGTVRIPKQRDGSHDDAP